jgi:putative DNA methylase
LIALTSFSDLVGEARDRVLADARAAGFPDDPTPLHEGGAGAAAYADAAATYLAFAVDKAADRNTTLCAWETKMDRMRNTFGRQAIPMVWDYAETNPLSGAGGDIGGTAFAVFAVLSNVNKFDCRRHLEYRRRQELLPCPPDRRLYRSALL